ncbi:Ribosomal protein S11 [Dillenia turbinata]|uniref:Ribosomal protein S11 n=1 Tax=Dillenia turbinata TaxID=194707 RepID=A0AAN8YWY0_9MAGN
MLLSYHLKFVSLTGCLKGLNLGRSLLYSSSMEFQPGRNSRPMDFVRRTIEDDRMDLLSRPSQPNTEVNADIVHITLIRDNTFVTVTDSKGNKKFGASSGSLSEMKGGPKLSRYAAEATAEHIGRVARGMGLKSVVMKVKGIDNHLSGRLSVLLSLLCVIDCQCLTDWVVERRSLASNYGFESTIFSTVFCFYQLYIVYLLLAAQMTDAVSD